MFQGAQGEGILLSEPQRQARAAAISTDTRDGHEMLRLLLQPPRILCANTGHYPYLPSQNPVQPPLPGSHDTGTTSPGEHMVHLRQLQRRAGL